MPAALPWTFFSAVRGCSDEDAQVSLLPLGASMPPPRLSTWVSAGVSFSTRPNGLTAPNRHRYGRRMGFMRKALFLGTGGLSGVAGVKANSKKDRTAKAAEKQLRLQKQARRAGQRPVRTATSTRAAGGPAAELERLAKLHASGALTAQEFAVAKARVLGR